jgi:2-polyprenyl-3-methyl-5-hydroxy-6-metoxy-1,4-benzoquinol methylase
MAATQRKLPYSVFAGFYDRVAAPLRGPNRRAREKVLWPLLRKAIQQSTRRAMKHTASRGKTFHQPIPSPPPLVSACDLCCGTGTTAIELARRGLSVYAVDRSAAMLGVARENFRRAGVRVKTIEADMRSFRLPEGRRVDFITCEFDAINHLARKQDLAAVARRGEGAQAGRMVSV